MEPIITTDIVVAYSQRPRTSYLLLDLREGAQRDELLYLQAEVLPAQFPIWRRSHIRQSSG
jgi:hypothetical protein